MGILC